MELEAMDLETQAERTAATREVQHLQTVLASFVPLFKDFGKAVFSVLSQTTSEIQRSCIDF